MKIMSHMYCSGFLLFTARKAVFFSTEKGLDISNVANMT